MRDAVTPVRYRRRVVTIGMSSSCTFPSSLDTAFRLARKAGFDGVETMVSTDAVSRSADALKALIDKHEMPVLSIHAPVLFFTQFVWGTDQAAKVARTAELAAEVGATNIVVHPPFRWQRGYAEGFLALVRKVSADTGIAVCVENMFPWTVRGRPVDMYLPGLDPTEMDCDAMCLDFSHAALATGDSLDLAKRMGERLRHVHLCDGAGPTGGKMFDEHLLPGTGTQPVAETLSYLADTGWDGLVVAEVKTGKAKNENDRVRMLRETVAFAKEHLRVAAA